MNGIKKIIFIDILLLETLNLLLLNDLIER